MQIRSGSWGTVVEILLPIAEGKATLAPADEPS
jgi:hypothetical protein